MSWKDNFKSAINVIRMLMFIEIALINAHAKFIFFFTVSSRPSLIQIRQYFNFPNANYQGRC